MEKEGEISKEELKSLLRILEEEESELKEGQEAYELQSILDEIGEELNDFDKAEDDITNENFMEIIRKLCQWQ
jgi:hypothetical protein